jgi:diacylglycerol O-acyltransferase / trehalose O-mycolyltransferase
VGEPTDSAWARHDPTVNVSKLVTNNTRIWVCCGDGNLADMDCADANNGGVFNFGTGCNTV